MENGKTLERWPQRTDSRSLGQSSVARCDTASEQAGLLQWRFRGDGHDRVFGHNGVLREGRASHLRSRASILDTWLTTRAEVRRERIVLTLTKLRISCPLHLNLGVPSGSRPLPWVVRTEKNSVSAKPGASVCRLTFPTKIGLPRLAEFAFPAFCRASAPTQEYRAGTTKLVIYLRCTEG